MKDRFKSLLEILKTPNYSRTLLVLLLLLAAIPLTVFVAQQQQETRQRAEEIPDNCECRDLSAVSEGVSVWIGRKCYDGLIQQRCNGSLSESCVCQASGADPDSAWTWQGKVCPAQLAGKACPNGWLDANDPSKVAPTPTGSVKICTEPDTETTQCSDDNECTYDFCIAGNPPAVCANTPKPNGTNCGAGKTCDGGNCVSFNNNPTPTSTPAPTSTPNPTPSPIVHPTIAPDASVGNCRDNPVNPPNGFIWKADCKDANNASNSCYNNGNNNSCPVNNFDPSNVSSEGSNWCYGFNGPFNDSRDFRCLKLVRQGCMRPGDAGCTPPSISCNTSEISLSISPNPVASSEQATLNINGDASAYLNDNFGGGITCVNDWSWTNQGTRAIKTCTAGNPGSYSWTHTWRHCEGGTDDAHCSSSSNLCAKQLNFTVASTSTPTPTPTSSPTPTPTPTPFSSCSLENGPCGFGIAGQPLGTCCSGLTCQTFPDGGICKSSSPTNTPTPTSTPIPSNTANLAFSIGLQGIGSTGDNANPTNSSLSNKNPKNTKRNLIVEILDSNENKVSGASAQQTLNFDQASGKFIGTISVQNILAGTPYIVKAKTDRFLFKKIPGIINLTPGHRNPLEPNVFSLTLVTGDVNNDAKLDALDYSILLGCLKDTTKNNPAICTGDAKKASDLNDDGPVDASDLNLFLRSIGNLSGD